MSKNLVLTHIEGLENDWHQEIEVNLVEEETREVKKCPAPDQIVPNNSNDAWATIHKSVEETRKVIIDYIVN